MRRLFDIVVSLVLLLLLLPFMVLVAITVKLTSPGPVFYRAERVGLKMKTFKMFKFRTMVIDADRAGPRITAQDDPRVTSVGEFLRSTKIDELPQLINVLKGEMALVGPRPEDPRFVKFYTPDQLRLLEFKPGVTGPAQLEYSVEHQDKLLDVSQAEEVYIREMLPDKLRLDLEYERSRSPLRDAKILLRSVKLVLSAVAKWALGRKS